MTHKFYSQMQTDDHNVPQKNHNINILSVTFFQAALASRIFLSISFFCRFFATHIVLQV